MFAKVPHALKGHLSRRNHHILVSGKCISWYIYQRLEAIGFVHRYLWQNLSVKLDILLHQPMHEVPIVDLANKRKKKIYWLTNEMAEEYAHENINSKIKGAIEVLNKWEKNYRFQRQVHLIFNPFEVKNVSLSHTMYSVQSF